MSDQPPSSIAIGSTDVRVSPVGVGAWAWGADFYWGGTTKANVQAAFDACVLGGITLIDTAEIYGFGQSEKLVGQNLNRSKAAVTIATKFFPYPWRLFKGNLLGALKESLKRLGLERVDLYQIHQPIPPIDKWVSALGDAVKTGLTRLAGVSNFSTRQTRRAHQILADQGIPLASNQIHYSLLWRAPEFNGLLDACRELSLTVIAYTPLEQGILTGKYTPQNPPPGVRRARYPVDFLEQVQPLVGLLREIGQAHGGKSPGQVAINWTVAKGTLPIPGARSAWQAQEIAGTLGWSLTADEVAALDKASARLRNPRYSTLESIIQR